MATVQVQAGHPQGHVQQHGEPSMLQKLSGTTMSTLQSAREKTMSMAREPQVQTVAATGAGGALALATAGGITGLLGGGAAGAAAGLLFAPLTFGLSIPIGAMIGGGGGAAVGTAAGALTGLIGGGTAGRLAYGYRTELMNGAHYARTKAQDTMDYTSHMASQAISNTWQMITDTASSISSGIMSILSNHQFQTAVSMMVLSGIGAFAGGAPGAIGGLIMGGMAGGALGILGVPLTFGLSIPIGAILGSLLGLAIGAMMGGTTGLLGGGAAGYGLSTRRHKVMETVSGTAKIAQGTGKMGSAAAGH